MCGVGGGWGWGGDWSHPTNSVECMCCIVIKDLKNLDEIRHDSDQMTNFSEAEIDKTCNVCVTIGITV